MQQEDFFRLMQEATARTRAGDLEGATAAIQLAMRGPQEEGAQGDAIDVESRWIPDGSGEPTARQEPPTAQGGREGKFTAGRFGSGPAGREYKLYVPAAAGVAGAAPLPLVVMLHGCTQDPDDFAAGTGMNDAAREQGFLVLYPAQSRKANPQRCWNWFKHTHQGRDRGEPAILAAMVRDIAGRYPVDPSRIYVAGLSAGGAMAAILAQTHPDLFAAVGVHSGLPAGAARDLPSALEAMKSGRAPRSVRAGVRVPTIVIHGDSDATVHPTNGSHVHAASLADGAAVEVEKGRAAGGRTWTRHVQRDAAGRPVAEHWVVHGAGHAWSGGDPRGSYTDPGGPDATAAMLRFFMEHRRPGQPGA